MRMSVGYGCKGQWALQSMSHFPVRRVAADALRGTVQKRLHDDGGVTVRWVVGG